jgi:hypothetical protein
MINLRRSYTLARMFSWLHRWRVSAYWRPVYEGPQWYNISAPYISLVTPYGTLSVLLWEFFNKVGSDFHYWGIVLLKINRRALFSATHEGIRVL